MSAGVHPAKLHTILRKAQEKLDDERGLVHVCIDDGHESHSHDERRAHEKMHLDEAETARQPRPERAWNNETGEWV